MDLWIRSQDKTKLKKTNYLQVEFDSWQNKSAIICNTDVVAVYETKERAMEVLNEIQSLLSPRVFINDTLPIRENRDGYLYLTSTEGNISTYHCSSYVYEMPKE